MKRVLVLLTAWLFFGVAAYAGNGDLTVNGNLSVLGTASGVGGLINVRVLTSGTTYTPTPGTHKIIVEVVGGGGSGGGVVATAGAGNLAVAGGGGSGGYARKFFSGVSATYSYSIGAGGAAPPAGANFGNPGGNTTFTGPGSLVVTAYGGGGGCAGGAAATQAASCGGNGAAISTNGDLNIPGAAGSVGIGMSSIALGGRGGASAFGAEGRDTVSIYGRADGYAAGGYGSGGGGGASESTNAAGAAGGAGDQGVIIIWEFN